MQPSVQIRGVEPALYGRIPALWEMDLEPGELFATLYTDLVNDLQEREKHKRVAAEITQTGGQKHLHDLPSGVLPVVALSFNILFDELAHLFELQWVDDRPI